jgi:hypothetical protein
VSSILVGVEQPLCTVNLPGECIRSLFCNKLDNSLFIAATFPDQPLHLRCRSVPLASLRTGSGDRGGRPFFTTEVLMWPGSYVELEENGTALTLSTVSRVYKVWDMATGGERFWIAQEGVRDVRSTGDSLVVILHPAMDDSGRAVLPLRFLHGVTGEALGEAAVPLVGDAALELTQPLGECLVLKQSGGPLQLVDLASGAAVTLQEAPCVPFALVYSPGMAANDAFLVMSSNSLETWDLLGQRVATVHKPTGSGSSFQYHDRNSLVFVSGRGGAFLIAPHAGRGWSVFDVRAGRWVAGHGGGDAEARVTAMAYEEGRHELFVGNAVGQVQMWG